MTKQCPICQKLIKNDEIVVALLLAKFKEQEDGYGLEAMAQTISSHLYCVEKPMERKTFDVVPAQETK
jgi:hypothetical protein